MPVLFLKLKPKHHPDPAQVGERVRHALSEHIRDPSLNAIFTDRFIDQMVQFSAALALWGRTVNLTARPQDPDETAFHIIDSLMPLVFSTRGQISGLSDAFTAGKRVLDFGSGAGFPGLILASACEEAEFTLTESRRKRASFLQVTAAELGLSNVKVLPARIFSHEVTASFDVIMSRASGPLSQFYRLVSHALLPKGIAILYVNPSQRLELSAAKASGLEGYQRYQYKVRRADAVLERVVAVWRRSAKAP